MKTLFLLSLSKTIFALHLISENPKLLLLPKTDNHVNPFNIHTDNANETSADFQLQITCNDNVITQTTPSSLRGDFCKQVIYTDSIKSLNSLLSSLTLRLGESAEANSSFVINYKLLYSNEGEGKGDLGLVQTMEVADSIPVVRLNTAINYKKKSETAFSLKIAEVSGGYFLSSDKHAFTIILKEGEMPDWLNYSFEEGSLYFSGSTPNSLDKDLEFSLAISDKITGLSSEDIKVRFTSSNLNQSGGNRVFILVGFVILSLVVIVVIVILYWIAKKNKLQKFGDKKVDMEESQRDVNVLSDSILNWNKKLVEKHRSKGIDLEVTEGSGSGQRQAPAFSYNKFDESFDDEEDANSAYFKVSDKLSHIDHVEEKMKKEDVDRSSFFDDISFN